MKPSFGRVPQWPLGAFAGVAVAGPLAGTVRDTALMLSAMARFDYRDPYSLPDDPRDWSAGIEDGVAGLRVAILRAPGFPAPIDADGQAAVEEAAQRLQHDGAEVEEAVVDLPDTRDVFSRIWSVALSRLVAALPEAARALLDPGLRQVAAASGAMTAIEFMEAEAMRLTAAHAMARLHQRFDIVLCPTVPQPAPLAEAKIEDPIEALWTQWAPWTFTFNLTRQPAISVPMGRDAAGLPRSVQVAAALYRDDLVLRAARSIERQSKL
jgi:aspartyl-tRNA(Asn)/glutamyl-tRNA(Gln) amidotransferase subunit A